MSSVEPHPETTLVLLLGASEFPQVPLWPFNAGLRNSAQALKQYFLDPKGLGVPESNVLDLFDSADEQPKQNDRIREFLIKAFEKKPPPSDLVVYYVGHGFSERSEYFLALHETREDNANSSYPAKALARVLTENARNARKYLILDCCYAGLAAPAFVPQAAGYSAAIAIEMATEFVDMPGKGTAVLCAADHRTTALAPVADLFTMFSGGLLNVLEDSALGNRPLTLEELNVHTYAAIKARFKDDAVRPNLHRPDQSMGDVAKVRLFPIRAATSSVGEGAGPADTDYTDAFEPDAFPLAQADRISCVVVAADSEVTDEGLALREHVRRAWDHYGQAIFEAVSRSSSARSREKSAAGPASSEPRLLYLSVDQLFRSPDRLASAVKAMCKAEVAVFDVTGFDARSIFMLGIRSVARRGVTICSVGGKYVIGGELSVPFNLQMLNLAAHSGAQEQTTTEPLTLIGQKIKNGFLELGTLPHYLDLPAYDSVRRLGVESTAYKPVQYHERVLALCPFNKLYTDSNWMRYLRPELTGKLKKRLAARNVNADSLGLVRLLDLASPRLVAQTLFESIRLTDMCIVDWTGLSANVMYEAGVRLATNPLGAVHIIEESESAIPAEHKAGTAEMIAFFNPIRYRCSAGGTQAYEKMISSFEASLERYRSNDIEMIYRTVGESIDRRAQSAAVPVVEELIQSANMLESDDQQTTGISPILYQDVNKELLTEAQAAAAERRLAAWLFIDRRYAPEAIAADQVLSDKFRLLGAQVLQWLRKNPDDKLVTYIKERLREIREIDSRKRKAEAT